MSLGDVRHQEVAQQRIQRALSHERMPHAYVLHGPDGVGKESFARGVAELLLCERPATTGGDASRQGCGRCTECRLVAAGSHPDFHVVHRELHRHHPDKLVRDRKGLELGVDVIRHFLIDKVALTPLRGRAKVFVIRDAHLMTAAAQNALLKTLEEPPGTTFLFLLTDALDVLLPTTRSRCQVVPFGRLPRAFIDERLAAACPDRSDEERHWCAAFAEGSLGRALEAVEDGLYAVDARAIEALQTSPGAMLKTWTEDANALGERYKKRDAEITDAEAQRRGYLTLLRILSSWFGDVVRAAAGGAQVELVHAPRRADVQRAESALGLERAAQRVARLAEAERHLDWNVHTQLALETLAADLLAPVRVSGTTIASGAHGSGGELC